MSIDIQQKRESTQGWKVVLFYISLIILIGILLSFLFLELKTIPDNTSKIALLEAEISQQGTSEQLTEKADVLSAESQVKTFKELIGSRPVSSNIFKEFENWVFPRIVFSNFSLSMDSNTISLDGESDSFQSLMQQILILEQQTYIKSFRVSGVTLSDEGTVTFKLEIEINPLLYKETYTRDE